MKKTETTHLKASRVGGVDLRLGSSTKWVDDVELQWAGDVEDRVRPTVVRPCAKSETYNICDNVFLTNSISIN